MSEIQLCIMGEDGNIIHGFLNTQSSKKLILHLHGLTNHANGLLEVCSSEFFQAQGFDHYRPSFYSIAPDSRKLHQSTISTHIKDIRTILEYFQSSSRYEQIFITAHSFSGLLMLISNPQNITAISLWDPSLDVTNYWKVGSFLSYMSERKQYILNYGNTYIISEEMVNEIKEYTDSACQNLARNIKTPTQFIIPEESIFLASPHTSPKKYSSCFNGDFDLQYIDKANHLFSYQNNRQRLFEHTLNFFKRYER